VALQGDLNSFALPEVLRLLAGTGKSGCLEVTGTSRSGEVWLGDGAIVAGVVSDAPHATEPSDVLFELLRLAEGHFVFDDGAELADEHRGEPVAVDEALGDAQALVERWADIEAVVPSMDAWLSMVPELAGDEVVVSAAHWRALAAIGSGGSVRDLADALGLTDLAASTLAKEMIDDELLALRPAHAFAGPTVALDSFEEFEELELEDGYELEPLDPADELASLAVEDRPVVMEDRDDALLPEPLPGEGVAYEGDDIEVGAVDGRVVPTAAAGAERAPERVPDEADHGDGDPFAAISAAAARAADPATVIDASELMAAEAGAEEGAPTAPFAPPGPLAPADASAAGSSPDLDAPAPVADAFDDDDEDDDDLDDADDDDVDEDDDEPVAQAPVPSKGDDERGSLLKFLSSVKP
jgi:hypothetical protein